jgi:hypothetical protein
LKRSLKRFFNWCPEPQTSGYGVFRQYAKPIFALVTVSIIAISLAAVSTSLFSHSVATAPLVIENSLPQTSTPTATPTATPQPTPEPSATPSPTPSPKPAATPTPTPTNSSAVPSSGPQQSTGTTTLSQGYGDEEVYAVVQSSGGNNALAGYTRSNGMGGSDVFLVKTEPRTMNGLPNNPVMNAVLWEKAYGGAKDDGAKALLLSMDGGYLLAGYTKSFGAGESDMWLLKVDSNGNPQWNMTYGGASDDGANCIVQANDGGYILAGYTNSSVANQTAWIVKVDAAGSIQWNATCTGLAVTSIARTSDGAYILAIEQPGAYSIVKLDPTGQIMFIQTYSTPSINGRAEAVVQTSDGGYALAGWLRNQTGENSTWLLKTDAVGTLQWNRTYTGYGAYSLIQTSKGGYAVTGDRAFLLITDAAGNEVWNRPYDSLSDPAIALTRGYAVIQPNANNYVIAMVQASYGQINRGLQTYVVSIGLTL